MRSPRFLFIIFVNSTLNALSITLFPLSLQRDIKAVTQNYLTDEKKHSLFYSHAFNGFNGNGTTHGTIDGGGRQRYRMPNIRLFPWR